MASLASTPSSTPAPASHPLNEPQGARVTGRRMLARERPA